MKFTMLVVAPSVDADNCRYDVLFVHCRLVGQRLARPRVVGGAFGVSTLFAFTLSASGWRISVAPTSSPFCIMTDLT
jgi:hypothetical protein